MQVFPISSVLIYRFGLLLVIILTLNNALGAQNLIPNPSFESAAPFGDELPFFAFNYLQDWESASFEVGDPPILLTPDLFRSGIEISTNPLASFWNAATGASNGSAYIGLTNIATRDGAFLPEAIGTRLRSPLEAGRYYFLSVDYRNKGRDMILSDPLFCIDESLKSLTFYFDEAPVTISLDDWANISTPSTDQSVELRTPSMSTYELGDWESVGTCFQANGAEVFTALAMTAGRVEVYPPCEIVEISNELFHHYYFDIDNLRLERVPDVYRFSVTKCDDETVVINFRDSLRLPPMLRPITFSFESEVSNGTVEIDRAGFYQGAVNFDCMGVPIELSVEALECTPRHYAPNAFSPNFDGINDEWKIHFPSGSPITNFQLRIYDRWGAVIFSTQDPEAGWPGTARGKPLTTGLYTWQLSYTFLHPELGEIEQVDGGEVVLLR